LENADIGVHSCEILGAINTHLPSPTAARSAGLAYIDLGVEGVNKRKSRRSTTWTSLLRNIARSHPIQFMSAIESRQNATIDQFAFDNVGLQN
jgi:hypothetical protein